MTHSRVSLWFSLLGLSFAVAGLDKLLDQPGYRRLFRHFGWSERAMRAVGIGELLGGLLLAPRRTRWLGGKILTATSTTVLAAELQRQDAGLALARVALLLAAGTALLPRR